MSRAGLVRVVDRIAVRVVRGDTVESVHRASLAVTDRGGRLVASWGDASLVAFLRSAAKPLQALALLETGAAQRFGVSDEELAVVAGSHNGEDRHVALVQGLLDRVGLGVPALRCGVHAPYGKEAAKRVGPNFTALHHNCSGKHAGMLAVCVHRGWDPATYRDPSHPLQRQILENVAHETGLDPSQVAVGVDGCGVPSFAVPLRRAARAFARLMDAEAIRGDRGRALRRLRDAMLAHPDLVAGEDRIDTRFMRAVAGDLWVKAGAEACYGFGVRPKGWGGALKIEDGATRAVPPVLFRTLEGLGVVDERAARALDGVWNEPVRNWEGRAVGRVECELPLRRPARRAAVSA